MTAAARDAFLEAMSRVPAAVHIVTTDGPHGRFGLTVASVCSVSADPPTVLVCIHEETLGLPQLITNRRFAVNLLAGSAAELSEVFSGRREVSDGERFAHGDWRTGTAGCPLLDGAAAALECELTDVVDQSTHKVLFGRVLTSVLPGNPPPPLLYWRRRYTAPG